MEAPNQPTLPGFQPPAEIKRVDVFFRCDGKRVNQARFYDDLSLWLAIHIGINQTQMINVRVDHDKVEGGYSMTLSEGTDPAVFIRINPTGKITQIEIRKGISNVSAKKVR